MKYSAIMNRMLFLIAAIGVSCSVHAKCIRDLHEIHGIVTSIGGEPVAGALVKISWREFGNRLVEKSGKADASGHFIIRFGFDLLSGESMSGDTCRATLPALKLSVAATDYKSYEKSVAVSGEQTTANPSLRPTAR